MHTLKLQAAVVGVIGYGEVGKIFTSALKAGGAQEVAAWDLNFTDPARGPCNDRHFPFQQAHNS